MQRRTSDANKTIPDRASISSTTTLPTAAPQKKRFAGDFILFSEFSELEGPVAVFTIPPNAEADFPLNDFVLRIMAVDHQASKAKESACFCPDTQLVLSEPAEDAYAYVHRFTLLDINARGYVRPCAMTYLTHDKHKIMTYFSLLLEKFSQISSLMKAGNHALFVRELDRRIVEIRLTQAALNSAIQDTSEKGKSESNSTGGVGSVGEGDATNPFQYGENTPTSVAEYLADLEDLARRLRVNMIASASSHRRGSTQSSGSSGSGSRIISPSLNRSSDFESGIGTSSAIAVSGTSPSTRTTSSATLLPADPTAKAAKIQEHLSSIQGVRNFERKLREISDLCESHWPLVDKRLQQVHGQFSRPNAVIALEAEELAACRKMIGEEDTKVPVQTMLIIGGSPVLNFNPDIDSLLGRNSSSLAGASAGGIPASNSNQLSPAMSSGVSIPRGNSSSALPLSSSPSSNSQSSPVRGLSPPFESELDADDDRPFGRDIVVTPPSPAATTADLALASAFVNQSPPSSLSVLVSAGASGLPPHLAVAQSGNLASLSGPPSPLSLSTQRLEKCLSGTSLDEKRSKVQAATRLNLDVFVSVLFDKTRFVPGTGLYELRNRYVWLKQAVFSLLKGRPLVIMANSTSEDGVRKLIRALSIFVPGHSHWRSGSPSICGFRRASQLKLSDFGTFRLIGVSKPCSIPKAVDKYVSMMDYEAEVLRAPQYAKGELLDDLLGLKKQFPDEKSYLAWIHYKLMDVAMRAWVYYQQNYVIPLLLPAATTAASSPGGNGSSKGGLSASSKASQVSVKETGILLQVSNASNNSSSAASNSSVASQLRRSLSDPQIAAGGNSANPSSSSSLLPSSSNVSTVNSITRLDSNIGSGGGGNGGPSVLQQQQQRKSFPNGRDLSILESDFEIIEYLTEVVMDQQITHHDQQQAAVAASSVSSSSPTSPSSAPSAPVIRLDASACRIFKNARK